ncbi:MAG: DUF4115 domain-containing protein [Gammaproteobacteria bacterium]|nr:MAG: DUF4115 domain-containing protein [Gammaproteobacteria bacterium]
MQDQGKSPGQLLKQKREEKSLSVDEVAQSLNLTSRTINAIEVDDYDSLPGATYARGYLRNYAQLLNISADPLIELFNSIVIAEEKKNEIPVNAPVVSKESKSSDKGVMLGTILVAVVIFGLAVAWWQGRDNEPSRKNLTDTVRGDETGSTNNDTTTATNADSVTGNVGTTIKDSDTHIVQKDTPVSGKMAQQNPQKTVVDTKTLTYGTAAGSKLVDANKRSVAVALDKAQSKIVIHAKQSSWVDIRDAKNNKLLYETVSAGRVVTIKGVGPFNIFLGNAAGIELKFNGKKYDLEQHRNGLVARFKLGNEINQ